MTDESDPPGQAADLQRASAWLARHRLAATRPSPLLAMRLAARCRARRAEHVILAVLVSGALFALAYGPIFTGRRLTGAGPYSRTPLVIMAALVVGLVLARAWVDGWVRRADRRAATALPRRAAHPVPLGWRAVLGPPYAIFTAAAFAGATALAVSALTVRDPEVRYGAVIALIGLSGVAAGTAVQLRDVLTRPVVAEDEDSLTTDMVLRVEDARERSAPVAVWGLPAMLLYGHALGWWNAATLALVLGAGLTLHLIRARTAPAAAMARQALSTR